MTLLRSPFPDIPTQPVRVPTAVPMPPRRGAVPQRRIPDIGFWLRICGLIFIVAVYLAALALYLPTVKVPAFLETAQPTPVERQCAYMTLIPTGNKQWIINTDYSCH